MRRIMPAAVLVLCATLTSAVILLPTATANLAAREMPPAALYFINWRLASKAVDYFGADTTPNLYLQYWSLAIEEQFYAFWPLILLLVAAVSGKTQVRTRILWTCVAISLISFAVCFWLTDKNQPYAFFGTVSRAWQLCVGALIAVLPTLRMTRFARRALVMFGLFAILTAASLFTHDTIYPGIAALLPTAGAAAIILAGRDEPLQGTEAALLCSVPLVHLGKWSYSWYLWHWPVLVLGSVGIPTITPIGLALLVLLSLLFACCTYYFIEQPVRLSPLLAQSPRRSIAGGLSLSLGAAGLSLLTAVTFAKPTIYLSTGERLNAEVIRNDKADKCMLSHDEARSSPCILGEPSSSRQLVLFGDSHAIALMPAIALAAKKRGWELLVHSKAACPSIEVPLWNKTLKRRYWECESWRSEVLSELGDLNAELILLANSSSAGALKADGSRLTGNKAQEAMREGEMTLVRQLLGSTSAKVVLIQDVPKLPENPIACLIKRPMKEHSCSWSGRKSRYPRGSYEGASKVTVMDVNEKICPSGICKAVFLGHVVWRDEDHLTASFASTLAPQFEALLYARP
jgi:peptidoglycan/LPS O-acetylase OafA/YrhL